MPYKVTYSKELRHHGIKGQKWGERNGPPYPLGAGDHSASEKKAGWRKSLDKSGNKGYNKGGGTHGNSLTDEQKKALAAGAAAVAGTLAVYGAYKAGLLNADTIAQGRRFASSAMGTVGDTPVGEAMREAAKQAAKSAAKETEEVTEHGFKKLAKPESLRETFQNVNPKFGTEGYNNNCTLCSITSELRRRGYNVTAKASGGSGRNGASILEDCFKNVHVIEGVGNKYCKSAAGAKELIMSKCCKDVDYAFGYCDIPYKPDIGGGHAFNWMYKNGEITFLDFQGHTLNMSGSAVDDYWKRVDPNGHFAFARLDNCEPRWEVLNNVMENC